MHGRLWSGGAAEPGLILSGRAFHLQSKNYSPPIPPIRISFLLIPGHLLCNFFGFSIFLPIGPLLDPYWTLIGSITSHAGMFMVVHGLFMVFSKNWISKNWTSIGIHNN